VPALGGAEIRHALVADVASQTNSGTAELGKPLIPSYDAGEAGEALHREPPNAGDGPATPIKSRKSAGTTRSTTS
jgi:hypothetical protein